MGDGVLIYFGYPQAHEHDAERAVRAGLEVVAATRRAEVASVPLQTRIGIATGLVVVGDLIGSGEAQERGIVGETPNLASRLQGVAEPNMVVIAEGTRRLLGNLFELEDLGPEDLKGIAGPVRVRAALRASSAEGRFEALHATDLTALVGKEEQELTLLLLRWERAKADAGQVVLLSGEAGIGKSRLYGRTLWNASVPSRTRACDISARRSTPTARSIRSSARWNGLPDWPTTTRHKRGSTNSTRCWRRLQLPNRTPLSLPNCCHCQAPGAIRRSIPTAQQSRQRTLEVLLRKSRGES